MNVRSWRLALSSLLLCSWASSCTADSAPPPQQAAADDLRLYVFDCGQLNRGEPVRYNLTSAEVGDTNFSDPCFLVVHPSGTLLWDLGIIPDDEIEQGLTVQPPEGGVGSNQSFRTLRSQLQEIGVSPDDITYVAMSHSHADHVANANDYTSAIWLVQRVEWLAMFSDAARARTEAFADYSELESAKTLLLNGDHDVFGDGSVMLIHTPCHTAGHQSLMVRLPNQGPVVLSGDLWHYEAERTMDRMPTNERNCGVPGTTESRRRIEELIAQNGGELWIQHDVTQFPRLKKSPEFYN